MKETKIGIVLWFDAKKGYGFIGQSEGEADLFVHFSDISCGGFKTLQKDQKVSYCLGLNKRGQPKAIDVAIVS